MDAMKAKPIAVTRIVSKGLNKSRMNVIEVSGSTTIPSLQRMLQPQPGSGARLGLDDNWARRAIRARGNLAQVYERNFGADSQIPIDRGPSGLWRDGGMIAAPPF